MFFLGAVALWRSGCSIPPLRVNGESRVALETYPKLVAQFAKGPGKYKGRPTARSATSLDERRKNRVAIVNVLRGQRSFAGATLRDFYGVAVQMDGRLDAGLIEDKEGDLLDAVLCAVQAAWAYTKRRSGPAPYGIPPGHDHEGWIVDPSLLTS
jgi:hypothetical protein